MNVKEHKGVYTEDLNTVGADGEFAVITDKDLQTVFECGDCETLHDNKEDAEKCCSDEE